MVLLLLLVLAVIVVICFARMTFAVVGAAIGLVIVLVTFIIRRRKQ